MSVTYKDIDQLSQKSAVAGTEKIPVSDTKYITAEQIALSKVVTSISSSSTDTQYPSAKCMYDLVGDIETLLNALL